MKMDIGSVNKTWRNAGLVALGVGLLAYPAFRLYKYLAARNNSGGEVTHYKLFPAYRGKHKPHHRKASSNGHHNHNTGEA